MKRVLLVLLLGASVLALCASLLGCNAATQAAATPSTPAIANVEGAWNLVLTPTGATVPAYTVGLQIAQSGDVATATQIPITLPVGYGGNCVDSTDPVTISGLAASEATITITSSGSNANRADVITSNPCTIVVSLTAIAASANGTYTNTANGSGGTTYGVVGSAVMTRQ
jgi:hypothetical protein